MPNSAHQFVVKGSREDGVTCFFTGSLGGKYPNFLRDRNRAYPMTELGAREIAARFSVNGMPGFRYDIEPLQA